MLPSSLVNVWAKVSRSLCKLGEIVPTCLEAYLDKLCCKLALARSISEVVAGVEVVGVSELLIGKCNGYGITQQAIIKRDLRVLGLFLDLRSECPLTIHQPLIALNSQLLLPSVILAIDRYSGLDFHR
jgi:hypothetical protein